MIDLDKLHMALDAHLHAMAPAMPTIWPNKTPPSTFNANAAHQKSFLLPASNRSRGLGEAGVLQSGIYQVNLCYPTGIGSYEPEARAVALAKHFKGQVLVVDGRKLRIRGFPDIAPPVSIAPYVVPVTIRYESIN